MLYFQAGGSQTQDFKEITFKVWNACIHNSVHSGFFLLWLAVLNCPSPLPGIQSGKHSDLLLAGWLLMLHWLPKLPIKHCTFRHDLAFRGKLTSLLYWLSGQCPLWEDTPWSWHDPALKCKQHALSVRSFEPGPQHQASVDMLATSFQVPFIISSCMTVEHLRCVATEHQWHVTNKHQRHLSIVDKVAPLAEQAVSVLILRLTDHWHIFKTEGKKWSLLAFLVISMWWAQGWTMGSTVKRGTTLWPHEDGRIALATVPCMLFTVEFHPSSSHTLVSALPFSPTNKEKDWQGSLFICLLLLFFFGGAVFKGI